MATSDYEALAQYFNRPVSNPGPGAVDIAKFIILNAENSKASKSSLAKGNEPSLMGRIFDVLSRPNYAVANFSKGLLKGKPDVNDIVSGLAGTQKVTFKDVLAEQGISSGLSRVILGLGLDIALDPISYIPVAGVLSKTKGLIKGAEKGSTQAKTSVQELLSKGEPVNPELFGLSKTSGEIPTVLRKSESAKSFILPKTSLTPRSGFATSQLAFPGMGTKLKLPEIITKSATKNIVKSSGQLSLKFPGIKASASNIVDNVAKGNPSVVARVTPMPKPKIESKHQVLAEQALMGWKHSVFSTGLNKKFPNSLNPKQQASLYRRVGDYLKKDYKDLEVYKTYLAVEKSLEDSVFVPRLSTGENVRLSDVINHLGGVARAPEVIYEFATKIRDGSPTWEAVQSLKASNAIVDSKTVQKITNTAGSTATVAKQSLSSTEFKNFEKFLKSYSSNLAKSEGVSPAGINAVEKLVDFTLRSGKSAAQIAVEQKSRILEEIIVKGGTSTDVNRALTRGLERDLGTLPKWAVGENKAAEFLMGRVATWWGQKDLRPLSLNAISSAQSTAQARGKALDNLFAPFDDSQRFEALRLAQGFGTASSQEVSDLSYKITQMLGNLTGRLSVITRSGANLDQINKWMRRYKVDFEFTNGKGKSFNGETLDFSKGSDWLQSWKIANVKEDPKLFLFKLQQALEQATREKALFDEIGERFGTVAYGGVYRNKLEGAPYLKGYYFTDDIMKQLPRVIKDWNIPAWDPKSPLLKHYDRVLSMWKSGVTIYRPAHHIRNMIGDIYLGWMDGVNSVRPYMLAAKVQRTLKTYTDISDVDKLVEIGLVSRNFKTPKPNEILFRSKSGAAFTAEQIGAVAHQKGLLEHARSIEDIIDLGETSRFKPFKGKVQSVARGASELQSHNARLAHFIDKIMKSSGNNLPEIFEQASRRARKWHPTGLDLTPFERKYFRRIIPFYSWLRKSTPLLLEGLVMNPGKAVVPSKLYGAIQDTMGIETPGRDDPFPVDQMFPAWIRSQGVGPISTSEGFLKDFSSQIPSGYVMGGVGLNPLSALMQQVDTPGTSLISSVTPAVKIPIELSSGRKLFTGEPIAGPEARPGAMEQYVGEQIPIYSALQSITGLTPFGTETKKSTKSGGPDIENFINYLTSAGIKGTGPYIQQAKFEKKAPIKMQDKINREEFLNELRKQLGG